MASFNNEIVPGQKITGLGFEVSQANLSENLGRYEEKRPTTFGEDVFFGAGLRLPVRFFKRAASGAHRIVIGAGDGVLLCDASEGVVEALLPSGEGVASGRIYIVRKIDAGAFAVNVAPVSGATINAALSASVSALSPTLRVIYDGVNWWTF